MGLRQWHQFQPKHPEEIFSQYWWFEQAVQLKKFLKYLIYSLKIIDVEKKSTNFLYILL